MFCAMSVLQHELQNSHLRSHHYNLQTIQSIHHHPRNLGCKKSGQRQTAEQGWRQQSPGFIKRAVLGSCVMYLSWPNVPIYGHDMLENTQLEQLLQGGPFWNPAHVHTQTDRRTLTNVNAKVPLQIDLWLLCLDCSAGTSLINVWGNVWACVWSMAAGRETETPFTTTQTWLLVTYYSKLKAKIKREGRTDKQCFHFRAARLHGQNGM